MNKLIISPPPHIHGGDSVKQKMRNVLIALLPAYLCALYFFGIGALIISVVSIVSCLLFEFIIQKYMLKTKPSITDGSALLTGVLLALNLPSNLPIWIVIIGALVAIGVGKMSFGGLGNNPFNPALVGRVFLLISFPVQMTSWPVPEAFNMHYLDATTAATPLAIMKQTGELPELLGLVFGNIGGSMGEVSALALLIGLAYLLITKTITWHIPTSIILTVLVFAGIMHAIEPSVYADALRHLLSGGLLLGAVFMATDYVTSPMTPKGQIIFGIGIGLLTVIIRLFGIYPEGMSFAILIMNALTPLINSYVKPRLFGDK